MTIGGWDWGSLSRGTLGELTLEGMISWKNEYLGRTLSPQGGHLSTGTHRDLQAKLVATRISNLSGPA